MRLAIDSNRYGDYCSGDASVVEVIRSTEEIFIPLIVVAELRAGFAHGTRREHNENILVRFMNSKRVRVVAPDEQTTHFYAQVYADLRRKGRPIPTNDIWIAAIAMQHDLVLYDRDRHFDQIPQLVRL